MLQLAERQVDQKQFDNADRTFTAALERTPDDQIRLERAMNAIRRGAFTEASDDMERFVVARKTPAALPIERAVLCASTGEEGRYGRLCRDIFPLEVQRFQGTSYERLRFAAVAPDGLDASGYDQAIHLLEQALKRGVNSAGAQQTLIALMYRAGRYRDAVERLEQSGGAARDFRAPALLFSAMAYARLGNAAAARAQMALAGAWITKNGPDLWNWPDRLEINLLSKEAQDVLHEQGIGFDPLPELK
jgi:tetratricopeptide (TPR) repeat protein